VSELRIGLGVDAHAFADGTPLVLGGIRFDEDRGLAGHSDGDVLTHALIDALLGAAALGDIGTLFPADDDSLRGVSSLLLLRNSYGKVTSAGFELVNADCILIGERPRIADRRDEMRARLADTMGVEADCISVRATTTDHLGFTGRREGLMAQAVALLRQPGEPGTELD
jgi:2-C-methyl-D-erythritol 2,4-cyclodiphosphate synthase